METPTIKPEDLSQFHSLNGEFKHIQEQASAAIFAAQENKANEITIARDGKAIVLPEKALWDEVWVLGPDCEGGKILAEKYPEAFALSAKANAKGAELKGFATLKWGIDPVALSLSDILRVCEAIVDYRLAQK